ncbi:Ig domain-containing protein [Actinoplanes derwentensis]|uniref:Prepilin-type N-terminal cleavage/methylation domain-containing protein n=1 Tax=Actinoplanes derwentensis TaxID=113562 RepID=A0A1H2D7E9_9ACTN|nr:Ig domain-containing protein [Actinoplanes derwentensis]GID89454.1 hypothetical protein Ade03nite_83780 [Actinoplanes derwentensis]SDT78477.1 prepilin-type N-terminal cleavage/methylation domain-containing protein [Actinoplanes derwentensis]
MREKDEGFSIVELIMAMAVLSIAMAGFGAFFINGTKTVDQQRDQRQAAQLASTAIEQVRALQATALMKDRGKTAVQEQWDEALTKSLFKDRLKPYLDSMAIGYDENATGGADAPISTSTMTQTINGTDFKQTIFVGTCEVYYAWTEQCVDPATATRVPADETQKLKYYRVVVLESWSQQGCAGDQCGYLASTLVSRVAEPQFDIKRPSPVVRSLALNPLPVFYVGLNTVTYQYKATGGTLPNVWTFTGLPTGLTGNAGGLISGTPTTAGTVSGATAKVTDDSGRSDTLSNISYTVVVPPVVTAPSAPKNHVGEAVSLQPTATGGDTSGSPKYTWTATGLPAGLAVDAATGAITGTASSTYTATIRATDVNGVYGEATYTHTVYPAIVLTKPADQTVALGASVIATPTASGGFGTLTFSASGLPLGVSINASTGVISGTPTLPGRYVPTISVTDSIGPAVSDRFILTVTTTGLTLTLPGGDPTSPTGQVVTIPVGTNASLLGITIPPTTTVTGLPAGVTWNSGKGTLSGTPTTPGVYVVTVKSVSTVPVSTAIYNFVWTIT